MTLNVSFSPATEAALLERAKAQGKPVESIVREVVEQTLGTNEVEEDVSKLTPQERSRRWQEWVRGMNEIVARTLPPGMHADDSRESIYE
jgi:hypothetical protein